MHQDNTVISSYHIVGTDYNSSATHTRQPDLYHAVLTPRAVRSVTDVWTILGAATDLLATLMALCFLVFGIVVAYTDNRSVATAPWIPVILSATQLVIQQSQTLPIRSTPSLIPW